MEPLSDPDGDRAMKDIIPPPHKPITTDLLYPDKSKKTHSISYKQHRFQQAKLGTT
jgi:hypothetical protein